jgi:predicted Zn-dependent protease
VNQSRYLRGKGPSAKNNLLKFAVCAAVVIALLSPSAIAQTSTQATTLGGGVADAATHADAVSSNTASTSDIAADAIPNLNVLHPGLPDLISLASPQPLPPAVIAWHPRKAVPAKYDIEHIGARGIGSGVNFYSLEKEQNLGRELSQEVEAEAQLVRDPVITEYVNRIGQNIVRNSDARVPFTIKVVDNDEINAFALPGGFFYVNTGLILAAENEAEMAGVMAHEIAHVAARHATKNATKADIWNLVSIPLIFMGGPAGYAVRQIAGLAVPMSFLKFSRDAEREADLLGLEYQYASGYDPAAFVQFFEKLHVTEKQKHSALAKAFSTHPMTEDRIKRADSEIENMLPPREQYVVTTSEFDEVKTRVMELANRHHIDVGSPVHPVLRRRDSGRSADAGAASSKDKGQETGNDGRPTLKRKDQ